MKRPDTNGKLAAPGGTSPQAPPRTGGLGLPRRLAWSLPLGWQLSVLYAVLLLLTLSLVGWLVYWQQEGFLVQDTERRLVLQAQRIAEMPAPPQHPEQTGGQTGSATGSPLPAPTPHPGESESPEKPFVRNLVRGLSGPGITVVVLDTQGTPITATQALEGGGARVVEKVTSEQVSQALNIRKPVQWIVKNSDGTRQLVVLMALTPPGTGDRGSGTGSASGPIPDPRSPVPATEGSLLVEQAASLAAVDAALGQLGLLLLLGVLGGTVVGVALVLAFTRGVLRPLDRVADTADAIAAGDLHRRLALPEGRNEVARLGKAFDYMVSRLVATLERERRFVADASHELRTPLTSLKGLAEILVIGAHGNDTRVMEQSARAINGELERLIRLVADLLTLSRLDNAAATPGRPHDGTPVQGPPEGRSAPVDICATIGEAVSQMAALAEARGVHLSQECAGPLPIMGDAGHVKQVLLNLIDNALRHTPEGGNVTVTGSPGGSVVRVEVRDTGSGIAPKDLPHIFERFYRGDTSRARATGNSGLGLAIAQSIVEAHGGTIEVQSQLGEGACFIVMLPSVAGIRDRRSGIRDQAGTRS